MDNDSHVDQALFLGINVVSIPVPDLAKAKVYYSEVLGLGTPVYDLPEIGWIEFSTGGPGGNLAIRTDEQAAVYPSTIPVLNVADCATAVQVLRARGVQCDDPQTVPDAVIFSTIYDPFGNRLEICSDAESSS